LAKAPYKFLAYLVLAFLPFGFEFLIAGDSYGAMAKFICTFIFFLWPIAIIWSCLNIGRAVFTPKSLFTEGMYRMFPVNWFIDTTGPNNLGPVDIGDEADICGEKRKGGIIGKATTAVTNAFTTGVQTIVGVAAPGLIPAIGAITGATQAVASGVTETATVASQSAQQIIKAATNPVSTAVSTVGSTVSEIPKAISTLPQVGQEVTQKLGAITTAEGLKKLAQKGGGSENDFSSYGLLLLFTILLGGGTLMAVRRMSLNNSSSYKKDATDTPPEPRSI
jgi:hypothetical protein